MVLTLLRGRCGDISGMSNLVAGICGGGGVGCLGVRDGSLTGGVCSRWSRLLLKPLGEGRERREPILPLKSCANLDTVAQTPMFTVNLQIQNSIFIIQL